MGPLLASRYTRRRGVERNWEAIQARRKRRVRSLLIEPFLGINSKKILLNNKKALLLLLLLFFSKGKQESSQISHDNFVA